MKPLTRKWKTSLSCAPELIRIENIGRRFQSGCQRMLLFVVSDRSIALHLQLLTSIKDANNTTKDALAHKRRTEWQKYPAGNVGGSCNSCGRAAASRLTSAQSRPPRIAGLCSKNICHAPLSSTHYSYFLPTCSCRVNVAHM